MACGEAIRTLRVCCLEQNCFSDRGRIFNLYFNNICDMFIHNISGHKSDGSDDYESLISLKTSKIDFTCLLRCHRKRAVCWHASENEPFVDATPKSNFLLYGGIEVPTITSEGADDRVGLTSYCGEKKDPPGYHVWKTHCTGHLGMHRWISTSFYKQAPPPRKKMAGGRPSQSETLLTRQTLSCHSAHPHKIFCQIICPKL